jgi:hypothetical protein
MGRRILLAFVVAAAIGCTSFRQRMNSGVSSYLAVASNPDDPRFLATVSAVLSDIEHHTYNYDDEARKWTFQAIERLRPDDLALRIRIRAIAGIAMPSSRSPRQLYDFVAILNALGLLSDVRDASAVDLNVMRLSEPLLGPSAAHNLNSLQAWNVTADVEAGLKAVLSAHHDPSDAASYLIFLNSSPQTSRAICSNVAQALDEFKSCSLVECNNGREAAIDLNARLPCSERK